jgi:hypothetical protein
MLVCDGDVNLLRENTDAIKKAEKTKCMMMSPECRAKS